MSLKGKDNIPVLPPKVSSQNEITVVEISLLDRVRDNLETRLRPFVEGKRVPAPGELGQILEEVFGPGYIQEHLGGMQRRDPNSNVIYVIHNLPEVDKTQLKKLLKKDQDYDPSLPSTVGIFNSLFNSYIVTGISEALSLTSKPFTTLIRTPRTAFFTGTEVHNHLHVQPLSAIAGVVSDGAETRFTNLKRWATLAPDERIKLKTIRYDASERVTSQERTASLADARSEVGGGDKPSIYITPSVGQLDALEQSSRYLTIGRGDLVLWAEDGVLCHSALPTKQHNEVHSKNEVMRAISLYGMHRPGELSL
jgi:hypothetical protein